ncbi:MAG: sigma-70 family RNA polymerase sigma factor [Chloroflexi bacterium]|nr:sigma-70 family RNA polymerase sigma factor [Chloroflexota bacterium]
MSFSIPASRPSIFLALASSMDRVRARWRVARPRTRETETHAPDDATLAAKHLAGDPHAFAELVKRYTRAVYHVTYRFTNNAADAENLTQETFLRAWNALPRLALDKPLKPYFVKIAVNLCRDWAARNRVELTPLDADDETIFAADAHDPLQTVSDQELRARVRAKLELLPPLYRTVIALRYGEEMAYEEMATALEMPLNTVRTHLHRAKARLRELLEQDE